MENVWLISAMWLGLALLASVISIRVAMSAALVEIMVGAVAGNTIGLQLKSRPAMSWSSSEVQPTANASSSSEACYATANNG